MSHPPVFNKGCSDHHSSFFILCHSDMSNGDLTNFIFNPLGTSIHLSRHDQQLPVQLRENISTVLLAVCRIFQNYWKIAEACFRSTRCIAIYATVWNAQPHNSCERVKSSLASRNISWIDQTINIITTVSMMITITSLTLYVTGMKKLNIGKHTA